MPLRRELVCLLLVAASVAAEPHLSLRVTDARTGKPLTGVKCGLVEGGSRKVYASFAGLAYEGERMPRAGDVLYVFARGYRLHQLTLDGEKRVHQIALRPWNRIGRLRIAGAGADDLSFTAQILLEAEGPWRDPPVEEYYVERARGRRLEVPYSEGMRVHALVTPKTGILWPLQVRLDRRAETVLRYSPPRLVTVRTDERLGLPAVKFIPDFMWEPQATPREIDAWRWRMGSPWWLENAFSEDGSRLGVAPDVPFHVFGRQRGVALYRHVSREDGLLDLRGPFRLEEIPARPRVAGKPAPNRALVAPGRLGLRALSILWGYRNVLDGCIVRLERETAKWKPIRLPRSEWLTVWHPDLGLAHMRWEAGRPPAGDPYPCSLVVTLPPGQLGKSGYVSLFTTWRGSGRVKTAPPDQLLRRPFEGVRSVRFPGLRPGAYGMDVQVEVVDGGGKPLGRVAGMRNLEVPENPRETTHALR